MSEARPRFARALQKVRSLVVEPAGPKAWFLNYPLWPWRQKAADRKRLDLLRILMAEAPVCGFCVDEDQYERLSAANGGVHGQSASGAPWVFASDEDAIALIGQLYEGNWCLFLFDRHPSEPPPVPRDFDLDPARVRQWLEVQGASAGVLSLPDDLEWLVVLPGNDGPDAPA